MIRMLAVLACFALVACQPEPATEPAQTEAPPAEAAAAKPQTLADILYAQPDDIKARYPHRHPQETIEFFGIEPGMTVVEALPGGAWYTKILLPWLGKDGRLIGVDYSLDMYPNFGFASEEFLAKQAKWAVNFIAWGIEQAGENGPAVAAFHFGSMPDDLAGTADVVFMVRALHNLARFETEGGFLTEALGEAFTVLKPGGTLGIVQHHARDEMSDEFADGSKGYLKKDFVIAVVESAGFEFVAESDVNANPKDHPSEEDVVWRLPPTLGTSRDDPELRAELEAIGESNRMTLRFRKPE
jgi:predicted methyltransferase